MVPLTRTRQGRFGDFWRSHLRVAADAPSVLNIIRIYLAAWTPEQLAALPSDLGSMALPSIESLMARAVLASRAELSAAPDDPAHVLLKEMALTLGCAADRIRSLTTAPSTDLGTIRELLSRAG